jgi:hypothetical protein
MRICSAIKTLIICIFSGFFLLCSLSPLAGGTDFPNTRTVSGKLYSVNGTPAGDAVVRLIPFAYNPVVDKPLPDSLSDTTDEIGRYYLQINNNGIYNIVSVLSSAKTRSLIAGVNVSNGSVDVRPDTLKTPGAIKVLMFPDLDTTNGYVYLPGTFFWARVRNGTATIDSVPAGFIPAVYYANLDDSTRNHVVWSNFIVSSKDTSIIADFTSWKYSKKVQFNTTSSGAGVTGPVTGFPVLVRLTSSNFDFSLANSDGSDIRFAKPDNTPQPFEIERWDPALKQAEIWVKVDTVYGNDSTHFITMYWGASTATSASNSAAVFDTANGFQGVWHLCQTAKDATTNHYNGTLSDTAPSPAAGSIGLGFSFDGLANSIAMIGTAAGKLNFSQNGFYTISAWVFADTIGNLAPNDTSSTHFDMTIVSKDNCQYALKTRNSGWEFFEYANKAGWQGSFAPAARNAWKYVVGIRQGTRQYLYVDGQCVVDSVSSTRPFADPRSTIADVTIGKMPGKQNPSSATDGPGYYFKGIIDEVRISNVSQSADWIKLCYMSQKPTSALVTIK